MMGIPHFRLLASLSTLLLAAAQARLHTLLRGGGQSSLQVPNATTVGNTNLTNQEVDDTFSSDIDDDADPESVYEATLQDEQVKAELASHVMQDVDKPADRQESSVTSEVVKPNDSGDLESIYEATKKASQREVESVLAKKNAEATTKMLGKQKEVMVNTTAAARPRLNHIKQLMDAIAHNSVKNIKTLANQQVTNVKKLASLPVPRVSMQVHTKRASKEAESPHLKKQVDAKADVNAVSQDSNGQSNIAEESYRNAEARAVHAAAKIVERGRVAASEKGDDEEVGIVGEEAAETAVGNAGDDDDTDNAQEAEDGEENAAGADAADDEENAAADAAGEADTQSEDIDIENSEDVDADAQQEEVEDDALE